MTDAVRELKKVIEKSEKTLLERWEEANNYLLDIELPMTKAALVERARFAKAPDNVLAFLKRIADRSYHTLEEIWDAAKNAIRQ